MQTPAGSNQDEIQINEIIEEWRNEDIGALDYEGQQNRGSNRDLHVDRICRKIF